MARPGTATGRCPDCGLICYGRRTPHHACVNGGRSGRPVVPMDSDPVELQRAALLRALADLPPSTPTPARSRLPP